MEEGMALLHPHWVMAGSDSSSRPGMLGWSGGSWLRCGSKVRGRAMRVRKAFRSNPGGGISNAGMKSVWLIEKLGSFLL
jgi:hypothetical protein